MILVAVGTFIRGFDDLVAAADEAAESLNIPGFAQIGHSQLVPRWLDWARFLSPELLAARMAAARLVICHGGMGLLGEAMRAKKPIIAVPRRGPTTPRHPAGDQTAFLRRVAQQQPIRICERLDELPGMISAALSARSDTMSYDLGTDIPDLLARFLAENSDQSLPTRSS